jgi:hypothetical protein
MGGSIERTYGFPVLGRKLLKFKLEMYIMQT